MSVQLAPSPVFSWFTTQGQPAVGYQLFTYMAGTSTPQATYVDYTQTTPNQNPIILNSAGYANVWLVVGETYKLVLEDAAGNLIWSVDQIPGGFALTATIIGQLLFPPIPDEGVTVLSVQNIYGSALRFGIIPNDPTKAVANTGFLQGLVSESLSATGWTGNLFFPPQIGNDVYWFDDIIDFRDNIYVDLMGNTLQFTKGTTSTHDTNAGFIFMQRNCGIQNGFINVNYTGGANKGAVIAFGARGSEAGAGAYYPNSYDSTLASTQGNLYARNLRITTNNPSGLLVQLTGGLDTVTFQNIESDGQSVSDGWDYEFGWATSGTTNTRQTSHAKNLIFDNVKITNTTGGTGTALTLTGTYNFEVRNLYVNNAVAVLTVGPGESLYWNPWANEDDIGCKRTKRMVDVVGEGITGAGITLQGSGLAAAGYLSAVVANPPLTAIQLIAAQTHLGDFYLDDFALGAAVSNTNIGINNSGHRTFIGHGKVSGFEVGIRSYDDAIFPIIEHVDVTACQQMGIDMAAGNSVVLVGTPVFLKKPIVRACLVAGNSTGSTNTYPGIQLNNTDSALIEGNRFNFETGYPGESNETTQGNGVQLSANANNVICRANRVGHVLAGSFAYYNVTATPNAPPQGNLIDQATGTVTNSGVWDGIEQTWTPVLTCGTVGNLAVTYTTQLGGYTKKGNRVEYWYLIVTSGFTWTTSSGNVQITGLPYVCSTVTNKNQMGSLAFSGITKASYTQVSPDVASAAQFVQFYASGSGQAQAHLVIGDLPSGGTVQLQGSGVYFV